MQKQFQPIRIVSSSHRGMALKKTLPLSCFALPILTSFHWAQKHPVVWEASGGDRERGEERGERERERERKREREREREGDRERERWRTGERGRDNEQVRERERKRGAE